MTLPANLSVYISALLFVLGAYFFALYLGMIVWAVRDIRSRSRDVLAHILTALLVAVFTLPGLLIYWLLRPHETLAEAYERSLAEQSVLRDLDEQRVCPGCQQQVEADFIVCPNCHTQLRLRCVGCGRLLDPDWDVCPYCGLFREIEPLDDEEDKTEDELDEAPAEALDGADVDVDEEIETDAAIEADGEDGVAETVEESEPEAPLPILDEVMKPEPEASSEATAADDELAAADLDTLPEPDLSSEDETMAEEEAAVVEAPKAAIEMIKAEALAQDDTPEDVESEDDGAEAEATAI